VATQDYRWRKSSFSDTQNCVEIGRRGDRVLVRDAKDRTRPVLAFQADDWIAFVAGVKSGEFRSRRTGASD